MAARVQGVKGYAGSGSKPGLAVVGFTEAADKLEHTQEDALVYVGGVDKAKEPCYVSLRHELIPERQEEVQLHQDDTCAHSSVTN